MSIHKTGSSTLDLLSRPDFPGADDTGTSETTQPRVRRALATGASRVKQAGSTVRHNPAPTAGLMALAGGVIAVLLVRRRAAQTRSPKAAKRWVPARFQR